MEYRQGLKEKIVMKPATEAELAQLLEWTRKKLTPNPSLMELHELVECLRVKLQVLSKEQARGIVRYALQTKPPPPPPPPDDHQPPPLIKRVGEPMPVRRAHGNAKLPDHIVLQIYHATGTQAQIASEYGVAQSQVSDIRSKRSYQHVTADL